MLPFKLIKDTPYLAPSGELWSVFYEYFNRNLSCYKGFLLYVLTVQSDSVSLMNLTPSAGLPEWSNTWAMVWDASLSKRFKSRACKQLNTVRCRYNAVDFLPISHNGHAMARPGGPGMGCQLWVWSLIYVLLLSYSLHLKYKHWCLTSSWE